LKKSNKVKFLHKILMIKKINL